MTDKMFGTEGIFDTPGRITMGKDYLSIPGIDYLGHAVFHKADAPLETHIHNNCMEFVFVVGGGQGYYIGDDYYQLVGDIDLHIKAGETVGIIGGTGCGKSSLVNQIGRASCRERVSSPV